MKRQNVESSMMNSIGYDAENSVLEIEFKSGVVWDYYDFSENTWYELLSSDSKGQFFHREIKGQYTEARVG